jgi:uncharacterized membrane protein (DUF4010 family)
MILVLDAAVATSLGVAALAGMAVGIERQRSGHTVGPDARFAGARTFFLIGTLGGLAGWLQGGALTAASIVILAAVALLVITAYAMVARQGGEAIDGTTEMAALMVLALGFVSGIGFPLVTSAITSLMLLVLAEKTRIHAAIQRVGELEMASALRFAILALVVLPLLPEGPFGPFDSIMPRTLWTVVLIFSGLNFAAYLANRWLGVRRGYGVSGLLGGLISSTVVSLQFSRHSHHDRQVGSALALGVVGACTVLVLRIVTLTGVLNHAMALTLVPYVLPVLLTGLVACAVLFYRQQDDTATEGREPTTNPLGLRSALLMAVAFQVTLLVIGWMQRAIGTTGVFMTAAVLGLTDMDALTYAMARLGQAPDAMETAARGIAIGMGANTLLKISVVLVVGRGRFRRDAAVGLALLGLATGMGLWLSW